MSQFKHIRNRVAHGLLTSVAISASSLSPTAGYLSLGGLATLAAASPAMASSTYFPRTTAVTPTKLYKINLDDQIDADDLILDWRNEKQDLKFKIPENHWVDDIELVMSADPVGAASKRTPLNFKLNNGKVITVKPGGRAFDARINLSTQYIRTGENKISISLPISTFKDCLSAADGSWDIDTKNSFLLIKTRQRTRQKHLRQINQTLGLDAFAPKTVSLLARGENKLKLQALGAQAVAMRMADVPNYRLNEGPSDLEIVAATRSELGKWARDPDIFSERGPRLYIDKGDKMRIVITGDTDADLLEMMQAFSRYKLPNARRSKVSLGELILHDSFAEIDKTTHDTHRLSELGVTDFDDNWNPRTRNLKFNVEDPLASSAKLQLDLAQTANIDRQSTLSVSLNGQSLGQTHLNKKRKSVVFDIPRHSLRGRDNVLTFTPKLDLKTKPDVCAHKVHSHGLNIKPSSTIKFLKANASPVTELSRLTSTGSVFSQNLGQDTRILLSARNTRDMAASFKVLGQLAKSSGKSWAHADYLRLSDPHVQSTRKNVMLIGPNNSALKRYVSKAPKSLLSGIRGQAIAGTIPKKTASLPIIDPTQYTKLAVNSANISGRSYKKARLTSSGLAAIYPTKGKLVGVITTTPGRSFSQSVEHLIAPQSWNSLSGSVARWNQNVVLMAQVAKPAPGFITPQNFTKPKTFNFDFGVNFENMVEALDSRYFALQEKAAIKWAEMTRLKPETITHPSSQKNGYPRPVSEQELTVIPKLKTAKQGSEKAEPLTSWIGQYWANLQKMAKREDVKKPAKDSLTSSKTTATNVSGSTLSGAKISSSPVRPQQSAVHTQADPVKKIILRGSVKPVFAKSDKVDWNAIKTKLSDPKKWTSLNWYDLALEDEVAALKRQTIVLGTQFSAKFKGSKLFHNASQDVRSAGNPISQSAWLFVWLFIFMFILLSLISPASRTDKS